jgi:Flp pilus assembly protein TadD/ADP-heptose:LPS heptosyltransferase
MENDGLGRAEKIERLAACFGAGDLSAAEEIARQLIVDDRQDEEALHLLAQIVFKQGRPKESIELMKAVLDIDPMRVSYNNDYGVMLASMERWEEAAAAYGMAVVLDRKNIDARYNLALSLLRTGQKERARAELDRVLAWQPDLPEALALNDELLREEGRSDTDVAHLINQGYACAFDGRMEGAIDSFKRALEINPRSVEAWNNLGHVYYRLHRLEEAEGAYRRALEIRPDDFGASLNLGLLQLLRGEFSEGWPRYEARWQLPGAAGKRLKFSQAEWSGDPLGQRTLLVYSEQGLGDNLQFARYLPFLRQRYPEARICFWCLPPLYRLFESCAASWGIEALPQVVRLPPIDVQIALMSLPWRMGTTLENIPSDVPYIVPSPDLSEKWSARLKSLPGRKVGVVWASGETYTFHKSRTVRLKQLEPLFGVGGISWVSLQKGNSASQIAEEGLSGSILSLMEEVEDFADTAAIIAHLDLVISVDTSAPHLAGAMGVPVWLLDRFDTDWRWLLGREDSPWYPTMRIFRQSAFGDWGSVMSRAAEALADWVGESKSSVLPLKNNMALCTPEIAGGIDSCRDRLSREPNDIECWAKLGHAYMQTHLLGDAMKAYEKALQLDPEHKEASVNLGMLYLLTGELSKGWKYYEARWLFPGMQGRRPSGDMPEWSGEPLDGKTLFVYMEQGSGDNIQFARYLPLLRQRYPEARIYYWGLPPLYRLFESCAASWGIEVLPPMAPAGLPPIDVQIALMSLPGRMGTTLENIPSDVPYIVPPQELSNKWLARLESLPGRKVGVVWAGEGTYEVDKRRSVRLKQLEPLLGVGGISWVSLQKGNSASQIVAEGLSGSILNVMDEVEDFADTAAIIAHLDLVISVDTSVPHLAGAMDKPVWLLNRFDTDWRWLLGREDSPWYPTMRIFRQSAFDDWNSVLPRVAEALSDWVTQGGDDLSRTLAVPAIQALQEVDRIGDGDAESCFRQGNFYYDKGDGAQARHFFEQAITLRPDFADAHNNLGLLLLESGEAARAVKCFEKALSIHPDMGVAHNNLGNARVSEGRMESAVDSYKRALEIDPRSALAWSNLGNVYFCLLWLKEAEAAYRRALEIQPDYATADFSLGILLLLRGEFSEGWSRFDARWRTPGADRPKFSQPEWAGDPLGQRTLLVYSEGGLGDNLQFARYLPFLRQRYPEARIYYWCVPPLYRLFESCAASWGIEVLPPVIPGGLPPIDVQIVLMSLPGRMGTTLESIPAVPYIAAPLALSEKWSPRLESLPGKKVGVVWASGGISTFQSRSVRLKQLGPLLGVGGISWVSLQIGNDASQIVSEGLSDLILDVMDEVEDFADTAAIVANLDLVISVDVSVLHLAGVMGKPVWLLNRFNTDWRWLLEREDSPWYPTMRIFRQASFGDWDSVMSSAAKALADWVIQGGGDTSRTFAVPEALAAKVVSARSCE